MSQLTFFWCPTWQFFLENYGCPPLFPNFCVSISNVGLLCNATVEFPSLQLNVKPVEKYSRAGRVMLMPKVEWQCWLWQFPLSSIDKKPTLLWWWWLFPRVRGFWENVRQFIPRLRFFFYVEIGLRTLIPLFRPGSVQSGPASWDDSDREFPDELGVS